jgi:hypothetical protein
MTVVAMKRRAAFADDLAIRLPDAFPSDCGSDC